MSNPTRHFFSGSWPEFYDRLMVPVFFEPYARRLAERLKGMTSGHVMEIAAGTGVVTRELIRKLPDSVSITATDLSQPMLDRAQSHPGSERVRWQQADALALPFDDSSFDAIVCQFGVMFFADKRAAFREALRVLKPGGRFLFEVWDRREEVAIQYTASEIVGRALSLDPGSLLAPPYHDVATVQSDLAAAGFTDLGFETLPERSRTGSAQEAAIATCQGGVLRSHIESHAPGRLEEITDTVAAALAEKFGTGPIDAPMQAILFTSVRPVAP
jgi:SAM-dependent methyltransferase